MKLSIILPVRNESVGISKTLDFIINSISEINYEIIVINDFSDDNSYEIINLKTRENNKIKLLNNKKKGLGGGY